MARTVPLELQSRSNASKNLERLRKTFNIESTRHYKTVFLSSLPHGARVGVAGVLMISWWLM